MAKVRFNTYNFFPIRVIYLRLVTRGVEKGQGFV